MDYSEHDVPQALGPHVQCFWRLRDAAPSRSPQTIYPDGRCELIVHLATPMQELAPSGEWQTQHRCLFAAQARSAIRLRAAGAIDCLGARFTPAASAALFDTTAPGSPSLPALVDQIVALEAIDPLFARRLQSGLGGGHDAVVSTFAALLAERLVHRRLDARIAAVVALLDEANGNLPLHTLSPAMGMSQRSLQTRFLATVGMTIKEYAQVQRLQATIRQLDGGDGALAQTALAAGFADQAHATRVVRAFAGLTPARLRRALKAQRDGDETLAMAAVFVRGTTTGRR